MKHFDDPDLTDTQRMSFTYYREYGLSLIGLVLHHGLSEEEKMHYLQYVHGIDHLPLDPFLGISHDGHVEKDTSQDELPPSVSFGPDGTSLRRLLQSISIAHHPDGKDLTLEKWVFTNSFDQHMERVMKHLGIWEAVFDGTMECLEMGNVVKPKEGAYHQMMKKVHGTYDYCSVAFLDDSLCNVKTAHELGMCAVWVNESVGEGCTPPEYVDFAIPSIYHLPSILEEMGLALLGGEVPDPS